MDDLQRIHLNEAAEDLYEAAVSYVDAFDSHMDTNDCDISEFNQMEQSFYWAFTKAIDKAKSKV